MPLPILCLQVMSTILKYFSTKTSTYYKFSTKSAIFCTIRAHKGGSTDNIPFPKTCHNRHKLLAFYILKILTTTTTATVIITKVTISKTDTSKRCKRKYIFNVNTKATFVL